MRSKLVLVCILIVSILAGIGVAVGHSGQPVDFVVDSRTDGTNLWMIEQDEDQFNLLRTDADGIIDGQIRVPKTRDGVFCTINNLSLDNGEMYVYRIERDIVSNRVLLEEVCRCNFKTGKLEQVWTLPITDEQNQNNFSVLVREGALSYFTVQNDEKNYMAQAILHIAEPGQEKAKVKAAVQYDLGIGFTEFFYGEDGSVIFTTPDSKIFRMDPTTAKQWNGTVTEPGAGEYLDVEAVANSQLGEPNQVPKTKIEGVTVCDAVQLYPHEGNPSALGDFATDDAHTLYFYDTAVDRYYQMDLTGGFVKNLDFMGNQLLKEQGIASDDLRNLRFQDETHSTATVTLGANQCVLGVFDGENGHLVTDLTRPGGDLIKSFLLGFVLTWGAALVLLGGWQLFLHLSRGKIPIVTKVLLACIPMLLISMLALRGVMTRLLTDQLVDAQFKELYLISEQQVDGISTQLLGELNLDAPYDDIHYYELRQLLTALPTESTLYDSSLREKRAQQVYDFGYHWLYRVDNGVLTTVLCDQNYINVPLEYYYDRDTTKLFYQATEEKKTIQSDFHDEFNAGGDWIILAIPILDEDGQVAAVMETGTTSVSLHYAVDQTIQKVNLVNLVIFLVLMVILAVLVIFTLHPLRWLKKSVEEITAGNLGVKTRVRGRDEIADISNTFNQMSYSVDFHIDELSRLNNGYYKFVPSKMFEVLRKSSVTDVRLGDQVHSEISILSFNAVGFEQMASGMDSERMFTFINRIYSWLVPAVTASGGVIDHFENAGLIAFYTAEYGSEAALTAAVSVQRAMEEVNETGLLGEEMQVKMTNGISYGPVMIGIVGHDERLAATTVSEYTNLSEYLRRIAAKYSTGILMTASARSRITDFDTRFHARCIGYLHVTVGDKLEKIYDVFDGDSEETRWFKTQTKEHFEHGVDLYCQRRFYDARLVFIEVLKQNREDGAAKEYLYRCDQYYQMADVSGIPVFIEEY